MKRGKKSQRDWTVTMYCVAYSCSHVPLALTIYLLPNYMPSTWKRATNWSQSATESFSIAICKAFDIRQVLLEF